jgi:peptidoglycan/xylan/chitin deacetylase (PgdA/CDA1 family)
LDILKSYGFHATFFMTGNNNGKGEIYKTAPYPDLIQRMIAEGHQVASHTRSHYSLSNISHELRMEQMIKNEMAFNNIIGMWPTYMRPPYSDCTESSGAGQTSKPSVITEFTLTSIPKTI